MIDVKILTKPKGNAQTSAINNGGGSYSNIGAKEAAHALKADIADYAKDATHAQKADVATEADEAIHATEADHSTESDHATEADHALLADNAEQWDNHRYADYLNQPVRTTDQVNFAEVVSNTIRSAGTFVDGVLGEGFRLWRDADGLTSLCLDNLTVRQTMVVMELLIQKVRSVGGSICVSAANGRIKEVEDKGELYKITFEQDNGFTNHDLIRCQTFSGGNIKNYWVEVVDADSNSVSVLKSEFGNSIPEEGDECVLMGNTAYKNRQNMILISATEDGQPRVDVMEGVNGKTFANTLRVRLGNLDGIEDDAFPADNQPKGNGLYADNVYLKGTFLLKTGEDIKTQFEITEGKIDSAIEGLRQDFVSDKGYLDNCSFYKGMDKWDTNNEAVFFLAGNRWIWTNKNVLTKKGFCAGVTKDAGRTVVMIRNKFIRQKNDNLRMLPKFEPNKNGKKEAVPVFLSFYYKCKKAGRITIGFENISQTGFEPFTPMAISEDLKATDDYKQYSCSGMWNGTGDFRLDFSGEIYLYMLVLSTDKVDSLTNKYRTLFEQSENLIKMSAAVFDKDEKALQETGLLIKPEGSGIYMQTADGNMALIGVAKQDDGKTIVKLTGDNIQLEGAVTANGNFLIKEDGSIVARNGEFDGTINANDGTIGGFNIGADRIGEAVERGSLEANNLTIEKDFLKIGDANGHVSMGKPYRDEYAGGNYATMRIYNKKDADGSTLAGSCGLSIRMEGENNEYAFGIKSTAPLLASSCVGYMARSIIATDDSTATKLRVTGAMDFSRYSTFILWSSASGRLAINMRDVFPAVFEQLATEDKIVEHDNEEVAFVVKFIVRQDSPSGFRFSGIYDSSGMLNYYDLNKSDTIELLVYRDAYLQAGYQILNSRQ